jgi:hypothetical protein
VPVNRPNRHSIINRFPANFPKAKRGRWAEDRVIELRKACEANHGTAFPRYIDHLIASRDALEARIEAYMREMDRFEQCSVVKGALEHARQNMKPRSKTRGSSFLRLKNSASSYAIATSYRRIAARYTANWSSRFSSHSSTAVFIPHPHKAPQPR